MNLLSEKSKYSILIVISIYILCEYGTFALRDLRIKRHLGDSEHFHRTDIRILQHTLSFFKINGASKLNFVLKMHTFWVTTASPCPRIRGTEGEERQRGSSCHLSLACHLTFALLGQGKAETQCNSSRQINQSGSWHPEEINRTMGNRVRCMVRFVLRAPRISVELLSGLQMV